MGVILEARGLKKRYGDVLAVDDISFKIDEGLCCGLLGPNGAGKTTTLEIVEGLQTADAGEVLFMGAERDASYAWHIGIQFQNTALMDYQTVKEVLELFGDFYPEPMSISELVELCDLGDFLDRYSTKLSGGQNQRLLLALALINKPQLVFLDEPTTGLDPQSRRNFWKLIRKIRDSGKTIVMTTHYMEEAANLCDLLLIVDNGRVIAEGSPSQLLAEQFGSEAQRHTLEDLFLKLTGHGLRE